ncbi:serine/threonine-protein phosphatase 7 long form homolog [Nicotiana tomentosiformis]|uniref:serine/threonine-protein phosphatase 7 long form homolog n=1 Tax=Nicotiana tomentosiformis TaxID=4098 RepID=UPI00388CD7E1
MEVPPVHPGPASLELLLLQAEHRFSYIWEGQCLAQTFRARRVDDMWYFLRAQPLHPRVVRRLQDTSFYRIIEIGRLKLDWSLITALIERWRPDTYTFHLPIGVTTITLQDVEVLYGLPVNGHPVVYPHALREYMGLQFLEILQRLTGFQPAEEATLNGASCLQLTLVRLHLEAMDEDITDDTPDLHIDRYTRLLMPLMFGGVLFPNTSENLVSLRFLHHLERLDDIPGYSWGAAVLGYLYSWAANVATYRRRSGSFARVWPPGYRSGFRTLRRTRDDERLGHKADYLLPEQYHRGPAVEAERGRRGKRAQRGRGVPRGHGGSVRTWSPIIGR